MKTRQEFIRGEIVEVRYGNSGAWDGFGRVTLESFDSANVVMITGKMKGNTGGFHFDSLNPVDPKRRRHDF